MSGNYLSSAEQDPGVLPAMQAIHDQVAATAAVTAASQADARRFISDNGAAVVGGHAPVNSPTGSLMSHMPIPATQYPSNFDTFAEQQALVGPLPNALPAEMGPFTGGVSPQAADALLSPPAALASPVTDAGVD